MEETKSKYQLPPFIFLTQCSSSHFYLLDRLSHAHPSPGCKPQKRGTGSVKNGQFQSDYQASFKLNWTLGPVSLVPTEARNASKGVHSRHTRSTEIERLVDSHFLC